MLTISSPALNALAEPHRLAMAQRFAVRLRADYPAAFEPLDPVEGQRRVVAEMQQADQRGLASEPDVYLYVSLAAMLGWGYRQDSRFGWVEAMLRQREFGPPPERLYQVLAQLDV